MEVILLEKVGRMGDLGAQVSVKAGYARNYLIPQGKAVRATKDNIASFEGRRAELEKANTEKLAAAQARAQKLEGHELTLTALAGDGGKLFGSIGTRDLAEAISQVLAPVDKSEVKLPSGAIRQTGEYNVTIQIHPEVSATVKVEVVAE